MRKIGRETIEYSLCISRQICFVWPGGPHSSGEFTQLNTAPEDLHNITVKAIYI